jgi:hypothetical protein
MRSRVFCQYSDADIRRFVSACFHRAVHETHEMYRNSFAMSDPEQREEIEQDIDHEWRFEHQ